MAEKGFRIAKDSTKSGWESTDFPVLCETCLGDNPYVRMTREAFGGACHVCERPHAKYRWKAGSAGRFKNTVLCQMCSKLRNVCQCCMLDLTYGKSHPFPLVDGMNPSDSFKNKLQVLQRKFATA
jgi:pre-mRNA-splicing factor RBM22/SLT11